MKRMISMKDKGMKSFLTALLILFATVTLNAKSLYYYENFNDTSANLQGRGWDFDFAMNRFFLVDNTTNVEDGNVAKFWVSNQAASNRLFLEGDPNADPAYDQWYTGKGALFRMLSNSQLGSITATPEEPFGFQVIRYNAFVHRDGYAPGDTVSTGSPWTPDNTGNNDDDYGKGLLEVWLLQDNGAILEGDSFDNYVFWYDKAYNHDNWNNRTNNVWGYYDQYERDYSGNGPWTNMIDIDGNSEDPNAAFQKQYSYANYQATNELGIRMTHDGSKVTIYLNLDPLGNSPGLQNSWVKFAEADVAWANNLGIYFASESPTPEGNNGATANIYCYTMAQFGDLYMRTVASNIIASISPQKVVVNTNVTFTVQLSPQNVSVDDSGVGEIYIEKPAGFGAWDPSTVSVTHPVEGVMTRQTAAAYGYGSLGSKEFYAGTRDGMLYIRLGMGGSDAANDILSSGTISVSFSLTTPTTADSLGGTFGVYGDAVKHAGTGQDVILGGTIKYATTGKKKAYPVSTGALTVKTYTQPQAYAKLEYSPQPIIVGNDESSMTIKLSTEGISGAPDISKARIEIPAGFTVSNNGAILNISSAVLGPTVSLNNIYVASNFIYVYYTNIDGLPGANGFDKIEFTAYGTPSVPSGTFYTNYLWQVGVDSAEIVAGTSWQDAGTNAVYNSQQSTVAMSNAQAYGYIVTKSAPSINAKTAIFTNIAMNTNDYVYVIRNGGATNNNIKHIRIDVPTVFDVISNVICSNGGTNYVVGNSIYVDYTNDLLPGEVDKVSFIARHTLTNIYASATNVSFKFYADNDNTAGLTLQSPDAPKSWDVTISPPLPSAEDSLSPDIIYTSDVTNTFIMSLYNTSPNGVGLKLARIDIATNIWTNVVSVTSSHLASQTNIEQTNLVNGTNSILIHYDADANGSLGSYYDTGSGDTITIKTVDAVNVATFGTVPTNIAMPVFVYKTSTVTNDTNNYAVATIGDKFAGTNKVYVQFPPLNAAYYITNVDNDQINTTSITNKFTFFVTNQGDKGNRILSVDVNIPTDVSTNFSVNNVSQGSATPQIGGANNRIHVDLTASPLDGGEQLVLQFTMVDIVNAQDKPNVYLNPDVANDRGTVYGLTNIVSGKSGKIDFSLPKPSGGGKVSPNVFFVTKNDPVGSVITQQFTLVVTNTGIGTDLFNAVEVMVPQPLRGMIHNVASARLGTDLLTTPGYFNTTSSNLYVIYSNASNPILVGEGDTITVTMYVSNLNTLPTNGTWSFLANNGFVDNGFIPPKEYFEITNVNTGSRQAYGTERVSVNIASDTLTTDLTNTFNYTIVNGGTNNLVVDKVRIKIPNPPYVSVDPAKIVVSGVSADVSVSGGYIWVTNFNIGGGLSGGSQTSLQITALKNILVDTTNVSWVAEVYYTNNDNVISMEAKGTNTETIQLPPPDYYAYVDQTQIGKDIIVSTLNMTVTNVGVTGNKISLLKIVPPTTNETLPKAIITNIDTISSSLGGTAWYSNDGMLYVDYSAAGTNIPAGSHDVLTFNAYDNQDNIGFSGAWKVYAANLGGQAITNVSKDPIDIGQSLGFTIVVPTYASTYYVSPNQVSTVDESNTISVYINNTGGGNNNILASRLTLSYPFITNDIEVTSAKGTNTIIGSNYVEILYRDGDMAPSSNDVVTLKVRDSFDYGETNGNIALSARYNSSGSTYVDATLVYGESADVAFKMPYPDVSEELLRKEVYSSQKEAVLKLRFINRGKGSNKLRRLKVFLPSIYTNGFVVSDVEDTFATNISITSNEITLLYTNFSENVTNDIELSVSNTQTAKSSWVFEAMAFNGLLETNTVGVGNGKTNDVTTAPSAELITSTVYSSDISRDVQLRINNDSSGSEKIDYVKIKLPDIYTNVQSVSSLSGIGVSNEVSNIVVYYAGGIADGANDVITLTLIDNKRMYETNGLVWHVWAHNGTGYGEMQPYVSGALEQSMIIPLPEITNMVLTKWFLIKTSLTVPTNQFVMVISNTSAGENRVASNSIVLPPEMTNVVSGSILISHVGKATLNGNTITVEYTNALGLVQGETNEIRFSFANNESLQKSVNITLQTFNGSSLGANSRAVTINFNAPQEPTEGYLEGQPILYSIDHSAELKYHVNNGLYDVGINKVLIKFDNIKLKITNIYSELYSNNISFTQTPTNILIDYTALGGIPRKLDVSGGRETLHLYIVYTNSSSFTNDMSGKVLYDGSLEYTATKKPNGENDFVPVYLADFGRITGIALPGSANPTVRLYYTNTTVQVTNKFTNLITGGASSTTGAYLLDFVPQGVYNVSFTGDNYKETILSNVRVSNNVITSSGTLKMIRDLFSLSSTEVQTSLCLDDMSTKVEVPAGALEQSFSLNIWLTNMSTVQQSAVSGDRIDKPNAPASIAMYWFEMRDYNGNVMKETELKGDVYVTLHYNSTNIANQGWSEDRLAVYYWKESTGQWMRLGGTIDKDNDNITIKTSYLHQYYAIIGEGTMGEVAPGFVEVSASPKIFTPSSSDNDFSKVKISASFSATVDSYTIELYDLHGKLIRSFDRSGGGYSQGEIAWDGKDNDGQAAASGVYVYRIHAGSHWYTGTIVIAR